MAENSTGFHAPQEAARILAEAIDLARQGQILAIQARQQQLKTGNASPEK
jgi:nitrite reductase (cytochrome c-552)